MCYMEIDNSYPIDLGSVQIAIKLKALQDKQIEEREEEDARR